MGTKIFWNLDVVSETGQMSLETSHPNVAVSQVPTNHLGSENFVASTIPNSCADGESLIVFFVAQLCTSEKHSTRKPSRWHRKLSVRKWRQSSSLAQLRLVRSYDETVKPNAWFEVLTSLSLVFKEKTLNHGSHGFLPENDWESLALPRV